MSTQPTPTPPPLAVIIQALGEAIENARELSRFAENKKERAERAEEVRALVAALDWAESPPPPDLSAVPLEALLHEIMRRDMDGDCIAMVITPSDLSEFWECDDRGNTSPDSALPTLEEMRAIQKAFGRWQDNGGFAEVMEVCRDAWNDAKKEGGSK